MSILSDGTLRDMLPQFLKTEPDPELINPASIDIRIGRNALIEDQWGDMIPWDFTKYDRAIPPGTFLLVETYEHIMVPNGYAVELKLKSTSARLGWNHSLAFWVDPGWDGVLTMELHNLRKVPLMLQYRQRFAQIIVHELDKLAIEPYHGRYQNAGGVQNAATS